LFGKNIEDIEMQDENPEEEIAAIINAEQKEPQMKQ
jgi:hypothetical protein